MTRAPFSDLFDRPVQESLAPDQQLNLPLDTATRNGPGYHHRPSEFGRDYWTLRFEYCSGNQRFLVERWQAAGGDRWRCWVKGPGGKDLAPMPSWHRWHDAQRQSGRFQVDRWPKVLRPLIWALWWLSDQLWTFGEDRSGWKWDGFEAMQAHLMNINAP